MRSNGSSRQSLSLGQVWALISYNCQAITAIRSFEDITNEVTHVDVIGLQGTKLSQRHSSFRGLDEVTTSSTCTHYIWSFPYSKKAELVNGSCGVALALRKHRFRKRSVKELFPPPAQLLGRAGALRITQRGLYDLVPIVAYFPVNWHDILGSNTVEITARLESSSIAWHSMGSVWRNTTLPLENRVTAFKLFVRSSMLSALEAMTLTDKHIQRLETQQLKYIRVILGPTTREHTKTGLKNISSAILRAFLKCQFVDTAALDGLSIPDLHIHRYQPLRTHDHDSSGCAQLSDFALTQSLTCTVVGFLVISTVNLDVFCVVMRGSIFRRAI